MSDNVLPPDLLEGPQPAAQRRGLSLGSIVLLGAIVIAAAIVGLALARQKETQPTSGPAPDFSVTTFDGDEIRLSDLRGQVVVVNFWASWCIPCKDEAPVLQAAWEKYRDQGVVILGVAYVDTPGNSLAFMDEFDITYPNAPDAGTRISDAYHITGVPETFIIDQDGNIAEYYYAQVTESALSETLDRLIQTG
jgi:cytochrome c biogenesis protein CcmG/thiol:disulfide interchange protein DsbE